MNDFTWLPDLASRLVGGAVVYANDEFFGPREALIRPEPPGFQPATFGAKGQVYDGWETRRRRQPGHDIAIVRLGIVVLSVMGGRSVGALGSLPRC